MNGNVALLGFVARDDAQDLPVADRGVSIGFERRVQKSDGLSGRHGSDAGHGSPSIDGHFLDDDEARNLRQLIGDDLERGILEVQTNIRGLSRRGASGGLGIRPLRQNCCRRQRQGKQPTSCSQ